MVNPAPELEEPNTPDNLERRSPARGVRESETRIAALFLQDIARPKGPDAAKPATGIDEKVTAAGAKVKTDQNGLVRSIARSDGSGIADAKYSDDADKKLGDFTEIGTDKSQIVFKREGNSEVHKAYSPDGKPLPNIPPRSKVEFSANGNMSYLDAKGEKVIVTGGGATLPLGAGKFEVQFHPDGSFAAVIPSDAALAAGAKIRRFPPGQNPANLEKYTVENPKRNPGQVFTHSFNKATKQWECTDEKGQAYQSPQGRRAITNEGAFVYEDTIQAGGKPLQVSRVGYPNGAEELQNGFIQPDGSHVIKTYNDKGQFIGVQTFAPKRDESGQIVKDKDGRSIAGLPGKKYIAGLAGGKPRIYESDAVTGVGIVWDKQSGSDPKGEKWVGQVIYAGPNSPIQMGAKLEPRYDFNFFENGESRYKDERGAQHTEYKDRSQKITFADGSFVVTDKQSYAVRAVKDKQNYLEYTWKDSGNGRKELAGVKGIVNGVPRDIWSPNGREGVILPDGRFSYEDDQHRAVVVDLDSTITKYQVSRNEQRTTILSPVEVLLPNGAKRVIEPGVDPEHPKRVVDTFTDASGRNMQRTLEALPVNNPARAIAAHNQRMQEYKLTEVHLSNSNFNAPESKPKVLVEAVMTDLEVLRNGDITVTAPLDRKNPFEPFSGDRYELRARHMTDSVLPKGNAARPESMRLIDADTRLELAKQRFDAMYKKEIAPRLAAAAGPGGKAPTGEEFIKRSLQLPDVAAVPPGQTNREVIEQAKNAAAYRYELAHALLLQQKAESDERKRAAEPAAPRS